MNKYPKTSRFLKHIEKQNFLISKGRSKELIKLGFEKYFHKLARLNAIVEVYYLLEQEKELMIKELFYHTGLLGDELAMMDTYATLCQNRPVEAIDRLSSKEIDFYLRDDIKSSSFDYIPNEVFDFLSIGEAIKNLQNKDKKVEPHLKTDSFGRFKNLSCSEQFEIIEDILGEYFFSEYPRYGGLIICEDIDDLEIAFSTSGVKLNDYLVERITSVLRFHLQESQLILKLIL